MRRHPMALRMQGWLRGIFFAAASLIVAAGATVADAQDRYILKKGDKIAVSVLEDPLMDQTSLIRPDGRISLPIVGSILAEGMTPEDLQAIIARNLRQTFAARPTVTVSLVETEEEVLAAVYVVGQVKEPGRVDMEAPLSVLQALAVAGGPGPFAATERILIRKRQGGQESVVTFNYKALERGDGGSDIMLTEGDVIVVPERTLFD